MTDAPDRTGSTAGRRWWRRPLAVLVLASMLLGVAAGLAVASEIDQTRQRYADRLLPGAVIDGVDLSGMTRGQAVEAVEGTLADQLNRTITLRSGDRTWTTTPAQLGASADAAALVRTAFEVQDDPPWQTVAAVRFRDETVPYRATTSMDYPTEKARALVERIADELARPARDAELHWTRTDVDITPAQTGRRVAVEPTLDALMAAVRGRTDTIEVTTRTIEPEVTAAAFRHVLLLRQADHTVELYVDGERTAAYPVAVGQPGHRTPTGVYEVTKKRYMPTWINPDPNGWGNTMPARIGPGRDNPLGVRALNWSAAAIRFHGTSNLASIGTDASHGCVRLSNADVVDLYDRVEVGATIISTW